MATAEIRIPVNVFNNNVLVSCSLSTRFAAFGS